VRRGIFGLVGVQALWPAVRPSGARVEDFDLASCYTAALDSRVGGDQGDVEGFGQGDILSVVGGQVGMKALQARPSVAAQWRRRDS